jgi:hypothetical protein
VTPWLFHLSAHGTGCQPESYSYEHEVNDAGYVSVDLLVQFVHCFLEEKAGKEGFHIKADHDVLWANHQ